jgi:hypothetical protein
MSRFQPISTKSQKIKISARYGFTSKEMVINDNLGYPKAYENSFATVVPLPIANLPSPETQISSYQFMHNAKTKKVSNFNVKQNQN